MDNSVFISQATIVVAIVRVCVGV